MVLEVFRASAGPTLGVELELQLVDAQSMELRPEASRLLAELPADLRDAVKPEFHQCCIEINSDVGRDVGEVGCDLAAKLRGIVAAAGRLGLWLAWGGTHPFGHWRDQPVTADPRYQRIAEAYRETICRQLTFGLHVHVGVADGDSAARACDRVRAELPTLIALAANSPFWCGRATGLMTHRIEVLGAGPTSGLPPRLGSWSGYAGLVRHLVEARCIETSKELWWDVRPSPAFGTVEVRACDMPADLDTALALAALIHCLVTEPAEALHEDAGVEDATFALILQQNRWRAARHGLDAELVALSGGTPVRARERARALVDRLQPTAARLGCAEALRQVAAMANGPSGAERQLAAHQQSGDLAEVVRRVLTEGGSRTVTVPGWGPCPRASRSTPPPGPTVFSHR